jgi:hypothetical protein
VGRGQLAVFLRRSLGRYDADSGASLASCRFFFSDLTGEPLQYLIRSHL